MDFTAQRVVIIGGSSGFGLAFVKAVARNGAQVTIVSRSKPSVDSALGQLPDDTSGHTIDQVTDPAEMDVLFEATGGLDHLAHTVGDPLEILPLAQLTIERAQRFFQTRYFGALNAARAAASRIKPSGSITFTSGAGAERPGPGWSVAASVCGAVEALGRALTVELVPVRVNTVLPGVMRSPMWSGMDPAARDGLHASVAAAALDQRSGEAEDAALAFACATAQGNGTGTVIKASGGTLLT
jgi:NAD(P)-dependent dehydrogenase (short-subunit alcohol dehydrogenase family)